MKASITWLSSKIGRAVRKGLPVLFWLALWQLGSMALNQEILLVSPINALAKLLQMMGTAVFYQAALGSLSRIFLGFFAGCLLGVLLGALASVWPWVKALLAPLVYAVKATPVASFVILALLWVSAANLSVFISFLMVLPVLYGGVLAGIENTDQSLLEMATVFRLSKARTLRAVYAPQVSPYFEAACKSGLGLCWKAGIAAEVIGQPPASIGDGLYRAKLFLATDELFAWTVAVILLSVLFERAILWALRAGLRRIERGMPR